MSTIDTLLRVFGAATGVLTIILGAQWRKVSSEKKKLIAEASQAESAGTHTMAETAVILLEPYRREVAELNEYADLWEAWGAKVTALVQDSNGPRLPRRPRRPMTQQQRKDEPRPKRPRKRPPPRG